MSTCTFGCFSKRKKVFFLKFAVRFSLFKIKQTAIWFEFFSDLWKMRNFDWKGKLRRGASGGQPAQTLFKTKNWKADIAAINMTNDRWKMITCSSLFAALPSNWQQEILIHIFLYFPCPSKNYFNANQNSQKNVGYKYHKALSLSHVDWENSD